MLPQELIDEIVSYLPLNDIIELGSITLIKKNYDIDFNTAMWAVANGTIKAFIWFYENHKLCNYYYTRHNRPEHEHISHECNCYSSIIDYALEYNRIDITKFLIENNWKIGRYSMRNAIANGNLEVFKYLYDTRSGNSYQSNILEAAVVAGRYEICEWILVNIKDVNRVSAMLEAVNECDFEIIKLIRKHYGTRYDCVIYQAYLERVSGDNKLRLEQFMIDNSIEFY